MEEREFELQIGQELRIEIFFEQSLSVLLELGRAEKFGEELPAGNWITYYGPEKFAIFTWHGCKLKTWGFCSNIYKSTSETPMPGYLLAHGQINRLRYEACRNRQLGPRVIVAGGSSCGKSTLCKILLNYASKCGWRPTFVELDVTNNEMFLPGCISAASYYHNTWDPVLAYYYGHTSINFSTIELFKPLINELVAHVNQRVENELQFCQENYKESFDPRNNSYASGCIINFPPFLDLNLCESILNFVIDAFQTNFVLVIEQERLLSSLQSRGFEPIHLGKSGGVVPLEVEYKGKLMHHSLNSYFAKHQIHQLSLNFSEIKVFKVTVSSTPLSALTYGENLQGEGLIVSQVAPTTETLLNAVLGVLTHEEVLKSPVIGVVHVVEVDETNKTLKVLAPGPLPSKNFLLGSLKMLK